MFLHLDMDYFFAQIEEKRHPEAEGLVVVICVFSGRTKDSGAVSTVNYEGREYGIKSGMPIINAKRLAPVGKSLFLPIDKEYYGAISAQINFLIRQECKKVVQSSIDEWNAEDDLAPKKAEVLKNKIKKELDLNCTIGVAPSVLGAKMAAALAKPDGLKTIDASEERKMIDESIVEKVPGIGPKTNQALQSLGVKQVKDLAKIDPIKLIEIFGRKSGTHLHNLGIGEYERELGPEKEQEEVSRIGTLSHETRDPQLILSKIDELEKEAKDWLMEMKKSYKSLSIIFITQDLKTHTKSMSFHNPKMWSQDITNEEKELVAAFLKENPANLRRVGIRFGGFLDRGGQTTLF
ncbi:DNA polymerase IV [Candidatus Micrarchaeota archaeon]|nr:DNA polymerase IV [Candidatus Micrarchaeota archaeon]